MDNEPTVKTETDKPQKPASPAPHKKQADKNAEFKRKYFEFYDDIKISDRQDW